MKRILLFCLPMFIGLAYAMGPSSSDSSSSPDLSESDTDSFAMVEFPSPPLEKSSEEEAPFEVVSVSPEMSEVHERLAKFVAMWCAGILDPDDAYILLLQIYKTFGGKTTDERKEFFIILADSLKTDFPKRDRDITKDVIEQVIEDEEADAEVQNELKQYVADIFASDNASPRRRRSKTVSISQKRRLSISPPDRRKVKSVHELYGRGDLYTASSSHKSQG